MKYYVLVKSTFNFNCNVIAEAGKTELDQHTGRLAANLTSEVDLLTRQAKSTIDKHTGFYVNILQAQSFGSSFQPPPISVFSLVCVIIISIMQWIKIGYALL